MEQQVQGCNVEEAVPNGEVCQAVPSGVVVVGAVDSVYSVGAACQSLLVGRVGADNASGQMGQQVRVCKVEEAVLSGDVCQAVQTKSASQAKTVCVPWEDVLIPEDCQQV